MKFVTYLRVSTERQGQSGLGLEAQRAAVAAHVQGRGDVVAEFVEVESGKRSEQKREDRALVVNRQPAHHLAGADLTEWREEIVDMGDLRVGDCHGAARIRTCGRDPRQARPRP